MKHFHNRIRTSKKGGAFIGKILLIISFFVLLVGCNNEEKDNGQENATLQSQIESLMEENKFKYQEIIDLDIVGDFIYGVSLNNNGGLDLFIVNYASGTLKWVAGPGDVTILSDKESRYAYIIQPDDPNVTQVNVFGKPAKAVTYFDEKSEDYTREIKYWKAYTEKEPSPSVVEYIKN
ncbi:hypothetical protein [Pontibacillus litoralis]|uniref:hypothetical protein n=1 Tax=Pontibacillus litoralis TaxID=516703 RepID=UPI0018DC13B9|nr:hypothetical protein [Pontibacillus litoralis]